MIQTACGVSLDGKNAAKEKKIEPKLATASIKVDVKKWKTQKINEENKQHFSRFLRFVRLRNENLLVLSEWSVFCVRDCDKKIRIFEWLAMEKVCIFCSVSFGLRSKNYISVNKWLESSFLRSM